MCKQFDADIYQYKMTHRDEYKHCLGQNSSKKMNSEYLQYNRCQDFEVSDIAMYLDMSELLEASGAECWYA